MVVCALSEKRSAVESNCKASLLPPRPSPDKALWPLAKQPRAWTCATSLHLSPHQSSRLLKSSSVPKGVCEHGGKECLVMNYTADWKIEITTQKHAKCPRQSGCRTIQPTWSYLKKIIIIIFPLALLSTLKSFHKCWIMREIPRIHHKYHTVQVAQKSTCHQWCHIHILGVGLFVLIRTF